jgi:hypothetical protein
MKLKQSRVTLQCTVASLWFIFNTLILVVMTPISAYEPSFSDELYYFSVISKPFDFLVSIRQFGYVYYPFYNMLNGNMVYLRALNLLFTYMLGCFCCYQFIKILPKKNTVKLTYQNIILSSAVGFCFLLPFFPCHFAFFGPSYNTLDFQACIMIVTAIFSIQDETKQSIKRFVPWIFIGIGLWLLFMSKPTSLLLLSLSLFIYLYGSKRLLTKEIALVFFIGTFLFIYSTIKIDGTPLLFLEDFLRAIKTHSAISVYKPSTTLIQSAILIIFFIIIFSKTKIIKTVSFILIMILCAYSIFTNKIDNLLLFGLSSFNGNITRINGILLWLVALILFVSFRSKKIMARYSSLSTSNQEDKKLSYLSLFLISIPFCYGWTSDNFWTHVSSSGIFAIFSVVLWLNNRLDSKMFYSLFIWLAVALQATSLLIFFMDVYSVQLSNYTYPVNLNGSRFFVNQEKSEAVRVTENIARKTNFIAGTPIFDFSGQPAYSYILKARQLIEPAVPMPPQSPDIINYLKKIPCDLLSTAWIISEENSQESYKNSLPEPLNIFLNHFNANGNGNYAVVARWKTNISNWGQSKTLVLLKPERSFDKALIACLKSPVSLINRSILLKS